MARAEQTPNFLSKKKSDLSVSRGSTRLASHPLLFRIAAHLLPLLTPPLPHSLSLSHLSLSLSLSSSISILLELCSGHERHLGFPCVSLSSPMEFDSLQPPSDFDFREKLVFPCSLSTGVAPELDPPDSPASGVSTTDVSIASAFESPDNAVLDVELCVEHEMPCCYAPAARGGGGSGGSPVAAGGESMVAVLDVQEETGAEAGSKVLHAPGSAPAESSAAVRLQKVYRSYRTRRRLADSAVVAEELW